MTWFDGGKSSVPAGDRLEALWQRPEILQTPGAHNALSALLAKRAGFEALYLSGGAVSASLGLPDLGVMTIEEVLVFVRSITRASDLPLIVDGDTGYGEALNVMRLVRDLGGRRRRRGPVGGSNSAQEMWAFIGQAPGRAGSDGGQNRRRRQGAPTFAHYRADRRHRVRRARGGDQAGADVPRRRRRCDFPRGLDRRRRDGQASPPPSTPRCWPI